MNWKLVHGKILESRNTEGNHAYEFKEKSNGHLPAPLHYVRLLNVEIHATREKQDQILPTKHGEKHYKCEKNSENPLQYILDSLGS